MKIVGKDLTDLDIILIITHFNGCYGEYKYSKHLHESLINDGAKYTYNKKENYHEFYKELDKENTLYRIYLK
jgi:hypothetical protein